MTMFREKLEEWWTARINSFKNGEKLEPLTIRGILYLLRRIVGIDKMPQRSGFYAGLDKVEEKYGVPREDLRVITEPKINLVTRFEDKWIMKAEEHELRDVCALLYIEKSTIIAAMEEDNSLTDRGIHIIKAMGFSTRDVNKLIKKAQELGVPIFTLTDFDASGILIDKMIEKSGVKTARLGIDVELVRSLGLNIEDVREELPKDPVKLTHFKNLQKDYPEIADVFINVIGDGRHPYRIEIDGVFALAGKERFMEAILARADQVVPIKPLKKVLIIRRVPEYVDKLRWAIISLLDKVFEKVVQEELEPYEEDDRPFSKLSLSLIEETIEDSINERAENKRVNKILEALVSELRDIVKERMNSDERLD